NRIYFERRERQYHGQPVPALRIFNLDAVAKGVTAMFLNRPDLASQYQKRMYETFERKLFSTDNREVIYYTASLVLYRIHLGVGNGAIPQNSRKVKWHMLPVVRVLLAGSDAPKPSSKKMDVYCQEIIAALNTTNDSMDVLGQALKVIDSIGRSKETLGKVTIGSELTDAARAVRMQEYV
ncbi:MAG: hypothetical protein AAGJ56_00605, partial [Myxococcota bacterium]